MQGMDPAERELFAFVILSVGVGFLGVASYLAQRVRTRLATSTKSVGTVTKTVKSSKGEPPYLYSLVIDFLDASGKSWTFQSRAGNAGWKNMQGEKINIIYLSKDPADARVHKWWVQWMLPTMVAGGAVTAFVAGALLLLIPDL